MTRPLSLPDCLAEAARWRLVASEIWTEAAPHRGPYRAALERQARKAEETAQAWQDRAARFCPVFRALAGGGG